MTVPVRRVSGAGYGTGWRKLCPPKLMALIGEYRSCPDEQVVLLFQILSAPLNHGYKGQCMWVKTFNGQKARETPHSEPPRRACTASRVGPPGAAPHSAGRCRGAPRLVGKRV